MMNKKILVLDDEEVILEVIEEELTKQGFQLSLALTGEEAIGEMERAEFDLLIADLKLPTPVSGLHVIEKFKARFPRGKIIVITGYPDPKLQEEAELAGVDAYLYKPGDLRPDVISEHVKKVFEQ